MDSYEGDDLAAITFLMASSGYRLDTPSMADDLALVMQPKMESCTASSLELLYNALPLLGPSQHMKELEAAKKLLDCGHHGTSMS
eukprot:gene1163-4057_t